MQNNNMTINNDIIMDSTQINSTGIRNYFGNQSARLVQTVGSGDNSMTLWLAGDGKQAIETNAEPILDTDADWSEAIGLFA